MLYTAVCIRCGVVILTASQSEDVGTRTLLEHLRDAHPDMLIPTHDFGFSDILRHFRVNQLRHFRVNQQAG